MHLVIAVCVFGLVWSLNMLNGSTAFFVGAAVSALYVTRAMHRSLRDATEAASAANAASAAYQAAASSSSPAVASSALTAAAASSSTRGVSGSRGPLAAHSSTAGRAREALRTRLSRVRPPPPSSLQAASQARTRRLGETL